MIGEQFDKFCFIEVFLVDQFEVVEQYFFFIYFGGEWCYRIGCGVVNIGVVIVGGCLEQDFFVCIIKDWRNDGDVWQVCVVIIRCVQGKDVVWFDLIFVQFDDCFYGLVYGFQMYWYMWCVGDKCFVCVEDCVGEVQMFFDVY